MSRGSQLSLPTPKRFDLRCAVCHYGWYALAPNRWDAAAEQLHRPIRVSERTVVRTSTRQRGKRLVVACHRKLSRKQQATVKAGLRRMLRLDEDLGAFHRQHRRARQSGFGRLLRSPTLFEDMVKTITGCNVAWANTMSMNAKLCEHYGGGGFPSPRRLAAVDADEMKATCKVGYRAERIIRLARQFVSGEIDAAWYESPDRTTDELFDALRGLYGFGDYAAGNMLQCLGRYDRVAIDSETYRHFREQYGVKTPDSGAGLRRLHDRIERHYARYTPYQFLAYWYELWHDYAETGAFNALARKD